MGFQPDRARRQHGCQPERRGGKAEARRDSRKSSFEAGGLKAPRWEVVERKREEVDRSHRQLSEAAASGGAH